MSMLECRIRNSQTLEEFAYNVAVTFCTEPDTVFKLTMILVDDEDRFNLINNLYDDCKLLKKAKQLDNNLTDDEYEKALTVAGIASAEVEFAKRNAKGYLILKSEDADAIAQATLDGIIDAKFIDDIKVAKEQAKLQIGVRAMRRGHKIVQSTPAVEAGYLPPANGTIYQSKIIIN